MNRLFTEEKKMINHVSHQGRGNESDEALFRSHSIPQNSQIQ